jgi:hypothetical protein
LYFTSRPPTRDRWKYGHGVALCHLRIELLEIAGILIVHINIHEAMELSIGSADLTPEAGIAGFELLEQARDRAGLDLYCSATTRELPENGRNSNFDGHISSLQRLL